MTPVDAGSTRACGTPSAAAVARVSAKAACRPWRPVQALAFPLLTKTA